MTNNFEEYSVELDYEGIFNDWFEIEGRRKIQELSRQLRSFFNYKKEVIRYRFRSEINVHSPESTNFLTQKQKFESLSYEFFTLLNKFNKPFEEMVRFHNASQISLLSTITEKLSIFVHYYSEEIISNHPQFLRSITILAQYICLIKKCLYPQYSEFYEELEINYKSLEVELDGLLEKIPDVKFKNQNKRLEERLTS